jgi:hypothetical protein
MNDIHSDMQVNLLIGAATLAADNTPVSVDLADFGGAEIVLAIGAGGITFSGTNKVEFVLRHGDASDQSTHTAVDPSDVLGVTATSGIIKALVSAHASAGVYRFGYKGTKRYISLLADFSGTHGTGTPIAATAVLGVPRVAPVANQA